MLERDERNAPQIPKRLIKGLRRCLEAGMPPAQIEASLMVMIGVHEALEVYDVEELTGRTKEILRVLKALVYLDKVKRG